MPDKQATLAAAHIVEAVERIRDYLTGLDELAFLADGRTRDAVAMNLLVIGENAARLPVDLDGVERAAHRIIATLEGL